MPEMIVDGVVVADVPVLVAGLHRIEAAKSLGIDSVPCIDIGGDEIDAQLWEIAENLHRAELTALERDQHVALWAELQSKRIDTTRVNSKPGPKGTLRQTAEDLGMSREDVRKAVKVASLSEAAKEAAKEVGLDDNRTALLAAAKEATPEKQVAALQARSMSKPAPIAADPMNDLEVLEQQVAGLMSAWNKACPEARDEFLLRIKQ
jgi:ParB-like chromosome segregation protein Spo0J